MTRYVARRLVQLLPVLLLVSVIVFFVFRIIPGDAALLMLAGGTDIVDPETLANLRKSMGLDQPIYIQYLQWLASAVRGDLGVSYTNHQSVVSLLLEKLPASLELGILGTLVSLCISVPVGIVSALKRGSWIDQIARLLAMIGFCMPRYWLAVLLIMYLAVGAGWFPAAGFVSITEDPGKNLSFVALPVLSVALTMAAVQMRFLRSSMLDVISQDYVRTAYAKGVAYRVVMVRHALKNALIPFITIIGLELGYMLGSLVIIEQIFSWPGIGWLMIQAINQRDYAVVQGGVMLTTVGFVVANLLVDVAYAYLDPRIRYS